jgi:hypothetical protein
LLINTIVPFHEPSMFHLLFVFKLFPISSNYKCFIIVWRQVLLSFYYHRIFKCMVCKFLCNLGLHSCAYSSHILLFMLVNIQFLGVNIMFKFMIEVVKFVIMFLLCMMYINLSIGLIPSPHICLHLFINNYSWFKSIVAIGFRV